jgi:hypothetical protein
MRPLKAFPEGGNAMPSQEAFVTNQVLGEVQSEIENAMAHHGSMSGPHEAYGVLLEEVDEFWDEVKLNPHKMTDAERVAWKKRMHKELVQVAAMAVRAIVDLHLYIVEHQQNWLKMTYVPAEPIKNEIPNPPGPRYF